MTPPDTTTAHLSDRQLAALDGRARALLASAHVPYSGFPVGAVVVTADGGHHHGVNVENAAYGSTICAERMAIGAMVTAGDTSGVVGVVIAGNGPDALSPCGACRQVLAEFCDPGTPIRGAGADNAATWVMQDLLPEAFGPLRLAQGQSDQAVPEHG